MKIIKAYLIAAAVSAAILLIVFGVSIYYGEEQPVPAISYLEDAAFYDTNAERIELNTASVEELMSIDGIGRSTAEKIVSYAGKVGFLSVEDLLDIDGIGKKTYDVIRPYVTVSMGNWKETKASETTASETKAEPEISEEYVPSLPIDLNSASVEDLLYINGIGEVTANKIIKYAINTGFSSVDDLLNIDGIGNKKLEAIRPYVTVQNAVEITSSSVFVDQMLINLNTASVEELMTIKGIGQVTAEKIVDYARTSGFSSVDELININGIGEKKLESIRPYVTV